MRATNPTRPIRWRLVAAAGAIGLGIGVALSVTGDGAGPAPEHAPAAAPAVERSEPPPAVAPPPEPAASAAPAERAKEPQPLRGAAPVPAYAPRARTEWQGMRVEVSNDVLCRGEASCGLALACIEERCGPCQADDQCAAGEACVLDHCVPAPRVGCRSASDCGPAGPCVLSGYSAGPRGNEDMRAYCLASEAGSEPAEVRVPPEIVPAEPRPVSVEALRGLLEAEDPQIDAAEAP